MTLSRRAVLAGAAAASGLRAHSRYGADVVIYGATPGGIAAAVEAARLGQTVILAAHEDHIGGIVTNGLTNADIGKRQAVGGLFHEFTRRVVKYYSNGPNSAENLRLCRDGYWYEASAAEKIFHQMIAEQGSRIRLMLSHELKRARVKADKLTAITLEKRGAGRWNSAARSSSTLLMKATSRRWPEHRSARVARAVRNTMRPTPA